jgi:hypothetical protein
LDQILAVLFVVFYVDDAYVAARDPIFLQLALNILVDTFVHVGLETNIAKTQARSCQGRFTFSFLWSLIVGCGLVESRQSNGMPAALLEESAGNRCGRVPSVATCRISTTSNSRLWWQRSSSRSKTARCTWQRQVIQVRNSLASTLGARGC